MAAWGGSLEHFNWNKAMRALTVAPGIANSARLEDVPEPPRADGAVLVRSLALGVCGTDREIVSGSYGWAPPGEKRLVIGHELLGKCARRPPTADFAPATGSSASCAGPIRCRVPPVRSANGICAATAAIRARYKERNGYGADFFRIEPDFLVKVDHALGDAGVLVEPTSVVAKAWITPSASAGGRGPGSRRRYWSPAPGRSVFSPP